MMAKAMTPFERRNKMVADLTERLVNDQELQAEISGMFSKGYTSWEVCAKLECSHAVWTLAGNDFKVATMQEAWNSLAVAALHAVARAGLTDSKACNYHMFDRLMSAHGQHYAQRIEQVTVNVDGSDGASQKQLPFQRLGIDPERFMRENSYEEIDKRIAAESNPEDLHLDESTGVHTATRATPDAEAVISNDTRPPHQPNRPPFDPEPDVELTIDDLL